MYCILMIDDEHSFLKAKASFLMDRDCIVHCVTTANEAIGMVKTTTYDCILLDVMLNEINGFSLCPQLQKFTDAPIIFLSALADDTNQLEGFLAGGTDYITKDTSSSLFWAKIETRIRLSRMGQQILTYSPLIIDLTTRRVYLQEKKLDITSIEFDILALMATKPRVLFTVSEIYIGVWGSDPQFQGQTVQVHLSRMRRKLEKAFPRHNYIETVWGKGYQFMPMEV